MLREFMETVAVRLEERLDKKVASQRPPDYFISGNEGTYLRRWWVIPKNRFFNIYLHEFRRSDDARALHDHPWFNVSFVLSGGYYEHSVDFRGNRLCHIRIAGDLVFRSPWKAHRIELLQCYNTEKQDFVEYTCWSLFITGPRLREWGFHCPAGWKHWKDFVTQRDGGNSIGPGCEE